MSVSFEVTGLNSLPQKISIQATYDFNMVLVYFDAIFCNTDFMCDKRDVLTFLNLNPSEEILHICAKRYYNSNDKLASSSFDSAYASSFAPVKNRFKVSLIDNLIINEMNDIRYSYSDSSPAERKKALEEMEENHRQLKDKLKASPWPTKLWPR